MRFFQRALLGFNNLRIHFIFSEFNFVSMMSKISSPLVKMESWTTCQGGCILSLSRGNHIFFFRVFWNSTNLTYVPQFRLEVLAYDYLFQRQSHSDPDMDFFALPSLILFRLELSRIELPKLTPRILMEIFII